MMTRLIKPGVVGALVVLLTGCEEPVRESLGAHLERFVPDSTTTVLHDDFSGYRQPTRLVIADSATWQAAWTLVTAGMLPSPTLPSVEFSQSRLLLVALGGRPSSGYSVTIDSVVHYERGSRVYLTTVEPGVQCGTLAVITSPLHIVRVDGLEDEPVFLERTVTRDC